MAKAGQPPHRTGTAKLRRKSSRPGRLRKSVRRSAPQTAADPHYFRSVLNAIPDLVWLKDPEGVYLTCNLAFERFFGAPEARIVGRTDYDFVDRALADFFRAKDRQVMNADRPSSNEEWVRFPDGRPVLLETIKTPMRRADGKLLGVLGIARDITALKQTEEALTAALAVRPPPPRPQQVRTADIRKLEGALVLLVEHNELDQEPVLELLRQAGIRTALACNSQEALAQLMLTPNFDAVLMNFQMPTPEDYETPRLLRRQAASSTLPVIAIAGEREKALAAGMNDHLLKPLDPARLFATLAHWIAAARPGLPVLPGIDTRAGLAACLGNNALYTRLLIRFHEEQSDFRTRFEAARASDAGAALRCAHTLKGVAATLGIHTVQHAAQTLEQSLRDNAAASLIQTNLEHTLAELERVLPALASLTPAATGTRPVPADSPGLALLRSLDQELATLDCTAADTLQILLSLNAASPLAESLRPLVRAVQNYDFSGARAALQTLLAGPGETRPLPPPDDQLLRPHTGNTLLVVDDSPANLQLLESILRADGFKVRAALSGEIALQALASQPADLILLDVRMPGMDGYEVCQRLKADAQTRDIPVIFISALDEVDDKLDAFRAGAVDYIAKPFQPAEVLARVHTQLELASTRKALAGSNARLRQLMQQLVEAEKLKSLGHLAAGVAHELNTPVGNAMLTASALEKAIQEIGRTDPDQPLPAQLNEFVQFSRDGMALIQRSLDKASKLINSLKEVTVDRSSERRRKTNLKNLVNNVLAVMAGHIKRSGCTLTAEVPPELTLDTYPGSLEQILENLIQNAITHGFGDSPAGLIRISARVTAADEIQLSVADTGKGIPAADLSRVFDPFFTTRLGQGGSGLGLHIAYSLTTGLLGGRIGVRSTPGQGAEFTLTLPCIAPSRVEA